MSSGGFENILVITDHFTRYAQAIPTKNQTAHTTAKVLFEQFFCHYGFPSRLHSDQGRNFVGLVIKELCAIANVDQSRTTPYHPEGNGMAERFNQTLLNMLGTLEDSQKTNWKAHVPALVHAYNSTRHESTGLTPHFLMFGRHPRLAIDAFLGIEPDVIKHKDHSSYVSGLKSRLDFAYKVASREARKQSRRHKKRYDLRVRNVKLEPGDRVLIRNVGLKGKHKLADKWDKDVFIVVDQPHEDIPVFRVKKEHGRGGAKVLHRNHLLPFMALPSKPKAEKSENNSPDPLQSPVDSVDPVVDPSPPTSGDTTVSDPPMDTSGDLISSTPLADLPQSPAGIRDSVNECPPVTRKPVASSGTPKPACKEAALPKKLSLNPLAKPFLPDRPIRLRKPKGYNPTDWVT